MMKGSLKLVKDFEKRILFSTIIYFTLGLTFIFAFIYFAHTIVVDQFKVIENQELETIVTRFNYNIEDIKEGYYKLLVDYSQWDDTYEYLINQDAQYISENFSKEYMDGILDINYVAITDQNGDPLFTANYLDDENTDIEKLNKLDYTDLSLMIQQYKMNSQQNFYIETSYGVILFTINPITKSNGTVDNIGTEGYILFGVLLNDRLLGDLSGLNGVNAVSVVTSLPEKAYIDNDYTSVKHYHLVNEKTITLYFSNSLLDSVNSNGDAFYKIDINRTTYDAGLQTANLLRNITGGLLIFILTSTYIFVLLRTRSRKHITSLLEERRAMFNEHDAIMLLIDPKESRIIDCNPAASRFYGYSEKELLEKHIWDINILPKKELEQYMSQALNKRQNYFTFSHKLKNGVVRKVDVYSSPIPYKDGRHVLFSIIYDVTDREKTKQELEYSIIHDALTGLYNRRYYETKLEYYEKIKLYPLTIIMADVNGLKLINDTFGHQKGDQFLKETAELFRSSFSNDVDICRIGGDEFVIIIPGKKDKDVEELVVNITQKAKEITVENIQLSISFGISTRTNSTMKIKELFKVAEDRMYQAKLVEVPSMHHAQMDRIMKTLIEKDPYVEKHVQNVSILSENIARYMNLLQTDIMMVKAAGLLHDIGKIIIPSYILNKNDVLNDEEYTIVKNHSKIGYRILNASSNTKRIADIVLYHHERWDGLGYPNGLSNYDIPLLSRIICVADAYDAMTSYRSYKKMLTKEEALEELKRCKGTQFDPTVVDIFVTYFQDIIKYI